MNFWLILKSAIMVFDLLLVIVVMFTTMMGKHNTTQKNVGSIFIAYTFMQLLLAFL